MSSQRPAVLGLNLNKGYISNKTIQDVLKIIFFKDRTRQIKALETNKLIIVIEMALL